MSGPVGRESIAREKVRAVQTVFLGESLKKPGVRFAQSCDWVSKEAAESEANAMRGRCEVGRL